MLVAGAYKDPVENHNMRKICDKCITGFFVAVLGILWYCSTKYYVKPNQYTIMIYDIFGKEIKIDGVRTNFKIKEVAQSHISEYKNRFQHYSFSMKEEIQTKTKLRILKRNQR